MVNNSSETVFSTTDTALAAFLLISNIKFIKLKADSPYSPIEILFYKNSNNIEELEFQWKTGTAQGCIPTWFKAYRSFIHELEEIKSKGENK
jgi:hypothetical protein